MNDQNGSERWDFHQGDRPSPAEALRRLTDLARRELPPGAGPHESRAAFARFSETHPAAGEISRRPGRRLVWLGIPLAAASLLVAVWGGWRLAVSQPLSVIVAGGTVDEGGFVRAGTSGQSSLRFSDGTQVTLGAASRARVAETTRKGARVTLEQGRAHAHVVPRKGAQWVFDAGPCRVQVTGTRFEMRWSAAEQVLEVRVFHGGVIVKGPPAIAGVPMGAGQRLVMDVRQGAVRLMDAAAAAPSAQDFVSPPGPAETPGALGDEVTPPREGSPPATNPPVGAAAGAGVGLGGRRGEPWPARVLSGEFRTVIDEAERRGIDDVLRGESAVNVMALADAARYAGAPRLAQKALLKVRARFPRTAPAHRAAFLLGRLAEDQHGNLWGALRWYETYLADAPDDAFRAEALGRRMTATLRLSGTEPARDLATDYLRRYPQGAYAQAARAILAP